MSATSASLFPLAAFAEIAVDEANTLIAEWGHYLGPSERPFGQQAFGLFVRDEPVVVAVSASPVSKTAAGFGRKELVELSRLCRHPDHRWATRVALRLWREVGAQLWPHWPVRAAIAYSQNVRHDGDLYRFDGWKRVTDRAGSPGGGTWSKKRAPGDAVTGRKSLWIYRYETEAAT